LTAVKAWAELYGKPIAAVSGLEAIAAQSTASSGCIAAAMDARRGQVFGALYRAGGATGRLELVGEEILASASEFAAETVPVAPNESIAFITPTPELLLPTVLAAGLRPARVERASDDLAPWIGKIGLRQFERGETVDALSLDANYIRRCDAEVYWKQSK
jgi:tRNA threonylcarbamoyladenosine biosynthesis protein TsaB